MTMQGSGTGAITLTFTFDDTVAKHDCQINESVLAVPGGLDGAQGSDGAAGIDASTIKLAATPQVFKYWNSGNHVNTESINTDFTTTIIEHPAGTIYYTFYEDDVVLEENTTGLVDDYIIPATFDDMPVKIEVETRTSSGTSGAIYATDIVYLQGVQNGADAPTVIFTNLAHSLSRNAAGSVTYTGSGTDIEVYFGFAHLVYDNSLSAASRYKITVANETNILADPTPSYPDIYTARFGPASAFTAGVSNASIDFIITIQDRNDEELDPITYTQTFSVSQEAGYAYYIKPVDGTAIKNHSGTLGVKAIRITPDGEEEMAYPNTEGYGIYERDGTLHNTS